MRTKTMIETDRQIGAALHAVREAKGYSQSELGRKVGVTFQQVQKYEKGVNRVSGSMMVALSRALGVPVSQFFDGVPMDGELPRVEIVASSRRERRLLEVIAGLPASMQDKLVAGFIRTAEVCRAAFTAPDDPVAMIQRGPIMLDVTKEEAA